MSKIYAALCVGINEFLHFPESSLNGCVNDATAMEAWFYISKVQLTKTLCNAAATKANVLSSLKHLLDGKFDKVFFSFSSHGTQVADRNGDEADRLDEAFCCHDLSKDFKSGLILDDELFELLSKAPMPVEIWLDTCHSGTGLRKVRSDRLVKFIYNDAIAGAIGRDVVVDPSRPYAGKHVVAWEACGAGQVANDIWDGSKQIYCGAFTNAFLNAVDDLGDKARFKREKILAGFESDLDVEFGQTACLECIVGDEKRYIF